MNSAIQTPMMIVGTGSVGSGLAIELSWRRIPCMLLEQRDGNISTPKLGAIGVCTMEICRRWGIAELVRQAPFRRDYGLDMVFCTSITGHFLTRREYPSLQDHVPPSVSPEKKWRLLKRGMHAPTLVTCQGYCTRCPRRYCVPNLRENPNFARGRREARIAHGRFLVTGWAPLAVRFANSREGT